MSPRRSRRQSANVIGHCSMFLYQEDVCAMLPLEEDRFLAHLVANDSTSLHVQPELQEKKKPFLRKALHLLEISEYFQPAERVADPLPIG